MRDFHNPWGAATIAFLVLFFPAIGVLVSLRDRRRMLRAAREMAPPIHRPAIAHVHQIDFNRSGITVTHTGAIFARCAIAGCGEGVFIGRNVFSAWDEPAPATHRAATR